MSNQTLPTLAELKQSLGVGPPRSIRAEVLTRLVACLESGAWLLLTRENAEQALELAVADGALHTDDGGWCEVCQRVNEARRLLGLTEGDH